MILGTFAAGTVYARTPEQQFEKQKHDAKAGHRSTVYKLAEMYKNGYGTPRDLQKALELYRRLVKDHYRRAEARIIEVEKMIASGKYEKTPIDRRMIEIRQEIEKLEQEYNRLKHSR